MHEPNDVTPCDAAEVTHWDETADVIVVGFGAAGSAAAFSAAAAGAQVLVTERTGGPGARRRWPRDRVSRRRDPHSDGMRVRGLARRHVPLHDGGLRSGSQRGQDRPLLRGEPGPLRLVGRPGRALRPSFCADTSMAPDGTEGLVYSGGEDAYPFNQIARPAPRGTWPRRSGPPDGCSCGTWRPPPPVPAPPSRPIPGWIGWWSTTAGSWGPGTVLRRDGDAARPPRRRAHRRRVHLQRRHAAPALPATGAGTFKVGTEGDDGRGIRMAQASGRRCETCTRGRSRCHHPATDVIHEILVNGKGKRFINEDTYMGRVGQSGALRAGR